MIKTENYELSFSKLDGTPIEDELKYILDIITTRPDAKLYVGVDSKVKAKSTYYVIVIVIRYPGKGAHIIYTTVNGKKHFKADMEQRLWQEVYYAIELGLWLNNRLSSGVEVHIDISPYPRDKSHKLHDAAVGWLTGVGLDFAVKPYAFAAMRAADAITRTNRY